MGITFNAKNELLGLQYDLKAGLERGDNSTDLVHLALNKMACILEKAEPSYVRVKWE